ncbi:MAG: hypothetical protein Q7T55_00045, partial [Solirubrobacteraceae bacterium]|nr:hypothetical protein [Solirubrobacteraceae bacterium]
MRRSARPARRVALAVAGAGSIAALAGAMGSGASAEPRPAGAVGTAKSVAEARPAGTAARLAALPSPPASAQPQKATPGSTFRLTKRIDGLKAPI